MKRPRFISHTTCLGLVTNSTTNTMVSHRCDILLTSAVAVPPATRLSQLKRDGKSLADLSDYTSSVKVFDFFLGLAFSFSFPLTNRYEITLHLRYT